MTAVQLTLFPEPRQACGAVQRRWARRPECQRRLADGRGRHENSLAAHRDQAVRAVLTGRRAAVAEWVRSHGPCTVREIVEGLFGPGRDMNMARPRVTELLNAGVLREAGRVHDPVTGVMVSRVELSERQMV